MPTSASPGIGSRRDTDPGQTTSRSYSISYGSPSAACTVTVFLALVIVVTAAVTTVHLSSTLRSGTTTWRGSTLPAAASGRKG